jgi:hypothetical protein
MQRQLCRVAIAALGVGLWVLPAAAHHSRTAIFDDSKVIDQSGVLKRVEWENPHMWIYVDVKDGSGKVTTWEFEGASPNNVQRNGTSRQDLLANIGKMVTVRANPARNGEPKGAAELLAVADGRTLIVGPKNAAQ